MRPRKIILFVVLLVFASGISAYFARDYWIHRYDVLIERQAGIYNLEKTLVWSVIFEETYFRGWMHGADEEVGLMQVTPVVAREWAKETGFKEFEKQTAENLTEFLRDPERNIQIGCWYLEKMREPFRSYPAQDAMTLAAYNAGASRVEEWTKNTSPEKLTEEEFISRIGISSTKAYVSSILKRHRASK